MVPDGAVKKVAFIGTSCTGKTTLCNYLAKQAGIVIVPEAARKYFTEVKVLGNMRYSATVQGAIQEMAIATEIEIQSLHPSATAIVCDRSALDAVIYTRFGGDYEGAERLFRRASAHIPSYSHLILLDPNDVPYRRDSIRTESAGDREMIHRMFVEFLTAHRIEYDLIGGTVEDRLARIWRLLKD